MITHCGSGDSIQETGNPDCEAYLLYGEEFFNSVPMSMFTVFRCMIGDCSSTGGQSLVMHFANHYGWKFSLPYSIVMGVIIFGVFNIITALLVESTLRGLQHDEMQLKVVQKYEAHFVRNQLKALLERMRDLFDPRSSIESERPRDLKLTRDDVNLMIQDPIVMRILKDLDVADLDGDAGFYDLLDIEGTGNVGAVEVLSTLLKVRGNARKSDLVANRATMQSLHEKFEHFELTSMENQESMLANQEDLIRTFGKAPCEAAAVDSTVPSSGHRCGTASALLPSAPNCIAGARSATLASRRWWPVCAGSASST